MICISFIDRVGFLLTNPSLLRLYAITDIYYFAVSATWYSMASKNI